ncbi:MAG: FRG domain-containing protein, partial [Bryobacteraceae bacterium]
MSEFRQVIGELDRSDRWIFRGQSNSTWGLTTSMERLRFRYSSTSNKALSGEKAEALLLREFKRHYHRYTDPTPDLRDDLEWLAIMQHHGAPTRLLDWTFSEYIALFFAINDLA